MSEDTNSTGTSAQAAPPEGGEAATPKQPQTVTAPPRLEVPATSTELRSAGEADTTRDYERLYNSMRGTFKESQRQWDEYQGQVETRMSSQQATISQLTQQLDDAKREIERLMNEAETVPELRKTADRVPELNDQIEKMKHAMLFPTIIGQTVVEEDEGQEVRRNAVLEAVLTSNLKGEAWQKMVEDVAMRLETRAPPAARPLSMTTPSEEGQPAAGESIESLRAYRQELLLEARYEEAQEINDRIVQMREEELS